MTYLTNDSISSSDESQVSSQNTAKRTRKIRIVCLLIVSICFVTVLFILNCASNFYLANKYANAFKNIEIYASYDRYDIDKLLPSIDFKLTNRNVKFTHRFGSSDDSLDFRNEKPERFRKGEFLVWINSFIKSIGHKIQYHFAKDSFAKLSHETNFEFKASKINTNNANVDCFDVGVVNNFRNQESNGEIETCFNLEGHSWFGGHESLNQPFWPINNQSFDYVPYVTGFADEWGAVLERYWLSSNGLALLVEDDVALFVNHNDPTRICLKASNKTLPYKNLHAYRENKFAYKLCTAANIKQVHMFMVQNYLGMASSRPDSLMMKSPIFTTWNYFFKNINQSVVIDYANQIHSNNYSISQLEIDDKWERFYGDLDFDRAKFPNPSEMVSTLANLNMRVTLWVHPFCNIDSMNFINGTNEELWVKDVSGQHPAFTNWWNGKYSTILDTTNPKTLDYFTNKLDFLKNTYGIRSFKFDAGESHWLPDEFSLHGKNSTLDVYAQNYVKLAANQNSFVEVRTAHRIQNIGLFYRILDRSSSWSINNGLKSVLTETLQFGLLGYPFVLPDMIGGNDDPNKSNKELFIRWTQLTAFLPAMQFGVPPWYFDDETNIICKKFVQIHEDLVFPYIYELPLNGEPIVRPMWWLEPTNRNLFNVSDQFTVGNDVLVAPVLDPGLSSRQLYIPEGKWHYVDGDCYFIGPISVSLDVKLDSIPYLFSQAFMKKYLSKKISNVKCLIK